MKIGIIGAMDAEVNKLIESTKNKKTYEISKINYCEGNIGKTEVVISQCGEGKVNSSICAQTMILKFNPDLIINTGVAGGLLDEMDIADIAVSSSVIEHDYDLTPLGMEKGYIPSIDKKEINADENTTNLIIKYAKNLNNTNVFKGIIVSGDQFINSNQKQNELRTDFNAICAEMEGASIGHTCYMNNTPFCIIRAISDKADNNSNLSFKEFTDIAAQKTYTILMDYILNL